MNALLDNSPNLELLMGSNRSTNAQTEPEFIPDDLTLDRIFIYDGVAD